MIMNVKQTMEIVHKLAITLMALLNVLVTLGTTWQWITLPVMVRNLNFVDNVVL